MSQNDIFLKTAIEMGIFSLEQANKYVQYYRQHKINMPFVNWLYKIGHINKEQINVISQYIQNEKEKTIYQSQQPDIENNSKIAVNQMPNSFVISSSDNMKITSLNETKDTNWQNNINTKTQELPKYQIQIGDMFRHYLINKELGRGGMGVVYEAFDNKLQRTVAIKVLLQKESISTKQIENFMREARAIAQINHQLIVKVYDVDETPLPHIVMEYIKGETLAYHIKNSAWKFNDIVALIQKCAIALETMHQHNIIHRDLKPGNIIAQNKKEILPKIMDFGLAKEISYKEGDEKSKKNSSGFVGTPAYASPEQVNSKNITHSTDIYSLGAILYESLTKRPPFQGESVFNIFYQILNEDIIPLRKLNPTIPVELEAICLKCLHKKQRQRYESMRQLGQDLQNYLDDRPILAKPPTKIDKLTKLIRRNKAISTFVVAVIITTVIAFTTLLEKIEISKLLDTTNENLEITKKSLVENNSSLAKIKEEIAEKEQEVVEKDREIAEKDNQLIKQKKQMYLQGLGIILRDIENSTTSGATEELLHQIGNENTWEKRWLQHSFDSSKNVFLLKQKIGEDFVNATINNGNGKLHFYTSHHYSIEEFLPQQSITQVEHILPYRDILQKETYASKILLYPNGQMHALFHPSHTEGKNSSIFLFFPDDNIKNSISIPKVKHHISIPTVNFEGFAVDQKQNFLLVWRTSHFFYINLNNGKIIIDAYTNTVGVEENYYYDLNKDGSKILINTSRNQILILDISDMNLETISQKPISWDAFALHDIKVKQVNIGEEITNRIIKVIKWLDDKIVISTNLGFYLQYSDKIKKFETKSYIDVDDFNISPNRKYIVSWNRSNTISLWNTNLDTLDKNQVPFFSQSINIGIKKTKNLANELLSCHFSGDSRYVFTCDSKIKIWDLQDPWLTDISTQGYNSIVFYDHLSFKFASNKIEIRNDFMNTLVDQYPDFLIFDQGRIIKKDNDYWLLVTHLTGIAVLRWNKDSGFTKEDNINLGAPVQAISNIFMEQQKYYVVYICKNKLYKMDIQNRSNNTSLCIRHFQKDSICKLDSQCQIENAKIQHIDKMSYDSEKKYVTAIIKKNPIFCIVWDTSNQTSHLSSMPDRDNIFSYLWSSDKKYLLLGTHNGKIHILNYADKKVFSFSKQQQSLIVKDMCFSKDEKQLITIDNQKNIYIWQINAFAENGLELILTIDVFKRNVSDDYGLTNVLFTNDKENNEYIIAVGKRKGKVLYAPVYNNK